MIGRVFICALLFVQITIPQTPNRLKPPGTVIQGADTAGKLWVDPVNLESRNLLYGSGGAAKRPKGDQFTFVKEDTDGTNPKIVLKDADGVEWKAKMGSEARPETAASRFVWAVGYFTRDYYFLPTIHVQGLRHLRRGSKYVKDGTVTDVRLMRVNDKEEKIGEWKWAESPFAGTREYNGLRTLLALLNDWDLKDVNNAIYQPKKDSSTVSVPLHRIYMVSDLGATFGTAGIVPDKRDARGNLESYQDSKFIDSTEPDVVNFAVPGRPQLIVAFALPQYLSRTHMQWIGKNIPRQDAAWMGDLLSRLSPVQIRDAFRCAGFTPEEVEGFAKVVEGRIAQLKALQIKVQNTSAR